MKTLPEILLDAVHAVQDKDFLEVHLDPNKNGPCTVDLAAPRCAKAVKKANQAIAKELMGCLPEKYTKVPYSKTQKRLLHTTEGYNKALDEVRARLTAFIGKEKS